MEEVWVPIRGFPRYEISNLMRVRLFSGKLIKVYENRYVKLNGIKYYIYSLMQLNAPDMTHVICPTYR
jgi:hypothetical protein